MNRHSSCAQKVLPPLLTAGILLMVSQETVAQQGLPLLGQGNISCESWTERRAAASGEADTMISWVLGYLTAFNQYGLDPAADISAGQETELLVSQIDEFCEGNPAANLYEATSALVEELRQETVE